LAETLSLSPPTLPGPDAASSSNAITGTGLSSNFGAGASELGIWSDEEEKKFYEDLFDLKDEVPTMLLGISADAKKETEVKADQHDGDNDQSNAQTKLEQEMEKLEMKDLSTTSDLSEAPGELQRVDSDELNPNSHHVTVSRSIDPSADTLDQTLYDHRLKQGSSSLGVAAEPSSASDTLASGPAARLTALFTRLDQVYNSDALDKIAVEFAYLNSKAARNRLIKVALRLLLSDMSLLRFSQPSPSAHPAPKWRQQKSNRSDSIFCTNARDCIQIYA
jgi:regulator of nonsense transcripts 2